MKVIPAPPVPYDIKRLNLAGLMIVLFGVVGSLTWAIATPLDSAAVAMGSVKVLSQKKRIQHLEGGIVESITVEEGQRVTRGDVLLTLDQTFAGSEYKRLVMKHHELTYREALLRAQRDLSKGLTLPELPLLGIDPQWVKEQKQNAHSYFSFSHDSLNNQLAINDSRLEQLHEQLAGLEREMLAKKEQLGFMQDEIESWKGMVERKLANKLRFLEVQRDASELKGILSKVESQIAETKVKIGEVELEKLQLVQNYQEQAANELRDIKFSMEDLSKQLVSAKNVLNRVDIRAPVDGVVVGLNVHTIGAVISPGETLLEIVPSEDRLIVESKINPTDIDHVFEGMKARIRIASFKQHEMPEWEGEIESVSADAIEDEKNQTQYYLARINIMGPIVEEGDGDKDDLMSKVQPGMPAEVMIKTGSSTPAQYLMEPLFNAFNRAWRDS